MSEILTDNRFELIEKYKQKLINATNIETNKEDMAAIDNILFRFWQMGWLDRLEKSDAGMTVAEYRERMIQAFHNADCDSLIAIVALPTEKEFQHLEWLLKKEYVPFLEKAKALKKSQQWIPVSERMPEEHEWIGTKEFGTTISDEVYVTFESPKGERFCKHLSFQNGKISRYDQMEIDAFHKGAIPIAWKPLPKPYEGGKQ